MGHPLQQQLRRRVAFASRRYRGAIPSLENPTKLHGRQVRQRSITGPCKGCAMGSPVRRDCNSAAFNS